MALIAELDPGVPTAHAVMHDAGVLSTAQGASVVQLSGIGGGAKAARADTVWASASATRTMVSVVMVGC